jgi:hypothetical protein
MHIHINARARVCERLCICAYMYVQCTYDYNIVSEIRGKWTRSVTHTQKQRVARLITGRTEERCQK